MSCMKRGEELRVCDVVQSWGEKSGGVKRYIKDKMKYVFEREHVSQALIIPAEEDGERREMRTDVYEVGSLPIPCSKGYRLLLDKDRILEIIRQVCPDIIEVGNAYRPAWVSIEAGRSENIPVVGFYHSDFPRSIGDKFGDVLKSVGFDEVVTEAMEGYLARLYNKMAATVTATRHFEKKLTEMGVENVVRIPLGADTQIFRPRDSRQKVLGEMGLPEDVFLMLYVGRFAGMKNIPELIACLDEIGDAGRPVHLALMGDGEYAGTVREAHESRDDVTWLPYSPDTDVLAERYSAADLFVNAGTRETFGLVSVEAQACGTRVLGVKAGGMEETLEGEQPLIMAESEDPADLARAVREIMELNEGREAVAERRERIVSMFDIQGNFDMLFRLYEHLSMGGEARDFESQA